MKPDTLHSFAVSPVYDLECHPVASMQTERMPALNSKDEHECGNFAAQASQRTEKLLSL